MIRDSRGRTSGGRRRARAARLPDSSIPLAQFLRQYLDAHSYAIQPRVRGDWLELLDEYIAPSSLGALRLGRLLPIHLARFVTELRGRGASWCTIKEIHYSLLGTIGHKTRLGDVVEPSGAGYIAVQRAQPFFNVPEDEATAGLWDAEAAQRFVGHVSGDPLHALWLLALTLGLRMREILALRWGDIDWKRARLTIHEPGVEGWEMHRALSPSCYQSLEERSVGRATDEGLVFTDRGGQPLSGAGVAAHLATLAAEAAVPVIHLRDLRHTAVALYLEPETSWGELRTLLGLEYVEHVRTMYFHLYRARGRAMQAAHEEEMLQRQQEWALKIAPFEAEMHALVAQFEARYHRQPSTRTYRKMRANLSREFAGRRQPNDEGYAGG